MGGSNSRLCAQKCTQILKTVRLCCPLSGDLLISHCSPQCDPRVLHPALSNHAVTCILHCHKGLHYRKSPALAFLDGMHVRTQLPSQHHFPLHTPQLGKNCRSGPVCGGRLLELLQTATVSPSPLKFVIRNEARANDAPESVRARVIAINVLTLTKLVIALQKNGSRTPKDGAPIDCHGACDKPSQQPSSHDRCGLQQIFICKITKPLSPSAQHSFAQRQKTAYTTQLKVEALQRSTSHIRD